MHKINNSKWLQFTHCILYSDFRWALFRATLFYIQDPEKQKNYSINFYFDAVIFMFNWSTKYSVNILL